MTLCHYCVEVSFVWVCTKRDVFVLLYWEHISCVCRLLLQGNIKRLLEKAVEIIKQGSVILGDGM